VVEGLEGEVVVRGSGGWQACVTGHIVVTSTHVYIYIARSLRLKRPVTKIGHNSEEARTHVKCMRAG
jgi:hypothetical protein